MDWTTLISIVVEIVKAISDKSKPEALEFAADLQAVAIESGDPSAKLIARVAMCAANRDTDGQQQLVAMCERYAAVADRAASRAKGA
jgi:hypothetical protein